MVTGKSTALSTTGGTLGASSLSVNGARAPWRKNTCACTSSRSSSRGTASTTILMSKITQQPRHTR
eukprot:2062993-Rhodomonas_salina.2